MFTVNNQYKILKNKYLNQFLQFVNCKLKKSFNNQILINMSKNNLTNEVKDLKDKGLSFNQIAEELGISKSAAYRTFNEYIHLVSDNEENKSIINKQKLANMKVTENIENSLSKVNPKLILHMRKMEMEHEKLLKEMEFDEFERQRDFQKEQMNLKAEILKMKAEIVELKHRQKEKETPNERTEQLSETDEIVIETTENEVVKEVTIPKKLQSMFSKFAENLFKFQNEEIEEETAKELLEQNATLLKYFTKWIKVKEIEPNEVPQRKVLKKLQKILQSITEDFENRGFFSSTYANFEIPEDLLDEISGIV